MESSNIPLNDMHDMQSMGNIYLILLSFIIHIPILEFAVQSDAPLSKPR